MYVKVRVTPSAKVERFTKKSTNEAAHGADHFEISVKQKAERNMANSRVVELVARNYKIPVGKVRIISGHHSPSKILSVDL
ncbi:MAG: DUF167 family protein [Patescibacteria group bacterium]